MNDTPNEITAAELKAACTDFTVQLGTDDIPPGAQAAARTAIAALENLTRSVERIQIKTRLNAIEKQAQTDRARLAELDGDA